jgi:hypothetical protein
MCVQLQANELASIPCDLGYLALETIDVSENSLTWLPPDLLCLPSTAVVMVGNNPLPIRVGIDAFDRSTSFVNSRKRLDELLEHEWTSFVRLMKIAIGLQDLALPALMTLEIIDALLFNDFPMWKKWDVIVAVKHFHDRDRARAQRDM